MIFPTRWKKDRSRTYAQCKLCGREFEEKYLREGICKDCLNDGEHYRCERCGAELVYTNRQKYIEKIPRPSICRKHFKRCKFCGNMFDEVQLQAGFCQYCLSEGEHYRCKRCGREMIYTNRQKYIDKVERPKICQECFKRKISKKDILNLFRNRGY